MIIMNESIWVSDETIKKTGTVKVDKINKNNKKTKIQVGHNDKYLYYDIKNEQIEIPLQLGAGTYSFSLCEHISGSRYLVKKSLQIILPEEYKDKYKLSSNQYVDCSITQRLAAQVAAAETDQKNIYNNIHDYIQKHFVYDYIRAFTISKNALPSIVYCLNNSRGICQDLAALAVSLLRNNNIPAKLVIGKADNKNHAWVEAEINGKTVRYDPTRECMRTKKSAQIYETERWY